MLAKSVKCLRSGGARRARAAPWAGASPTSTADGPRDGVGLLQV